MHRIPRTFFSIALVTLALATFTGAHGGNGAAVAFLYYVVSSAALALGILWYVCRGFENIEHKVARRRARL